MCLSGRYGSGMKRGTRSRRSRKSRRQGDLSFPKATEQLLATRPGIVTPATPASPEVVQKLPQGFRQLSKSCSGAEIRPDLQNRSIQAKLEAQLRRTSANLGQRWANTGQRWHLFGQHRLIWANDWPETANFDQFGPSLARRYLISSKSIQFGATFGPTLTRCGKQAANFGRCLPNLVRISAPGGTFQRPLGPPRLGRARPPASLLPSLSLLGHTFLCLSRPSMRWGTTDGAAAAQLARTAYAGHPHVRKCENWAALGSICTNSELARFAGGNFRNLWRATFPQPSAKMLHSVVTGLHRARRHRNVGLVSHMRTNTGPVGIRAARSLRDVGSFRREHWSSACTARRDGPRYGTPGPLGGIVLFSSGFRELPPNSEQIKIISEFRRPAESLDDVSCRHRPDSPLGAKLSSLFLGMAQMGSRAQGVLRRLAEYLHSRTLTEQLFPSLLLDLGANSIGCGPMWAEVGKT